MRSFHPAGLLLHSAGFSASDDDGWDLRRAQLGEGDLANYFTKMAHEVTGGHRKEGRARGGRTPMQLLADGLETYEESSLAPWWEWEMASDGRPSSLGRPAAAICARWPVWTGKPATRRSLSRTRTPTSGSDSLPGLADEYRAELRAAGRR